MTKDAATIINAAVRKVQGRKHSQAMFSMPTWVVNALGATQKMPRDVPVYVTIWIDADEPNIVKMKRSSVQEIRLAGESTLILALNNIWESSEETAELNRLWLEEHPYIAMSFEHGSTVTVWEGGTAKQLPAEEYLESKST